MSNSPVTKRLQDLIDTVTPGIDVDSIWKTAKENFVKLDSCKLHDFSVPFRKIGELVVNWECSKCHGNVSSENKHWYERGIRHASNADLKS